MVSLLQFVGVLDIFAGINLGTDQIRSLSGEFVLRRTFDDLCQYNQRLRLPELVEHVHSVTLSEEEKKIYNRILLFGQAAQRAMEQADDLDERRQIQSHLFQIMGKLQQCVVDMNMVGWDDDELQEAMAFFGGDILNPEEIPTDDCAICFYPMTAQTICRTSCGHYFCKDCLARTRGVGYDSTLCCPLCRHPIQDGSVAVVDQQDKEQHISTKMLKIDEIMESIGQAKTLIFTHWKKEMNTIREICQANSLIVDCISGDKSMTERKQSVDRFQDGDTNVLICQIQTASTGLNLIAAKHIIFPSMDWSPSTIQQAIARSHRIGQTQSVTVHYIQASGTIDDHVLNLSCKKLNEASEILGDERIRTKFGKALEYRNSVFSLLNTI